MRRFGHGNTQSQSAQFSSLDSILGDDALVTKITSFASRWTPGLAGTAHSILTWPHFPGDLCNQLQGALNDARSNVRNGLGRAVAVIDDPSENPAMTVEFQDASRQHREPSFDIPVSLELDELTGEVTERFVEIANRIIECASEFTEEDGRRARQIRMDPETSPTIVQRIEEALEVADVRLAQALGDREAGLAFEEEEESEGATGTALEVVAESGATDEMDTDE